jgi:hypothetical protein
LETPVAEDTSTAVVKAERQRLYPQQGLQGGSKSGENTSTASPTAEREIIRT